MLCCISSGLKGFYGKKARLKNEITKRQHENYVQTEDKRQVGDCVNSVKFLLVDTIANFLESPDSHTERLSLEFNRQNVDESSSLENDNIS